MAKKNNVAVVECARCHCKTSKEWHNVEGVRLGVECVVDATDALSRGVQPSDLENVLREEYKEMMRVFTTCGMIRKGMLSISDMVRKGKIKSEQVYDDYLTEKRLSRTGREQS